MGRSSAVLAKMTPSSSQAPRPEDMTMEELACHHKLPYARSHSAPRRRHIKPRMQRIRDGLLHACALVRGKARFLIIGPKGHQARKEHKHAGAVKSVAEHGVPSDGEPAGTEWRAAI